MSDGFVNQGAAAASHRTTDGGRLPPLLGRLAALVVLFAGAALDFAMRAEWSSPGKRARWLHRWSRRCARLLGLRIESHGALPRHGLIVANHLSYLDIIAISATVPCRFVAKCEVARWPVLGLYARMAGTVFIDRARRSDVARVAAEMRATLAAGLPLVVFAEGTSSDGHDVLPFKSSLLEPVCATGIPTTAAAIDYATAGGSVLERVCYWGSMSLLPHFLRFLGSGPVAARAAFGGTAFRAGPRKRLAEELRAEVRALRGTPDTAGLSGKGGGFCSRFRGRRANSTSSPECACSSSPTFTIR